MKNKIPLDMQVGAVHPTKNFGNVEIVEYNGWDDVVVRFLDTGYTTTTRSEKIRAGAVNDPLVPSVYGVGFIGVGLHRSGTGVSGKHSAPYKIWHGMFKRCYSGAYPTYKLCTVHPDWHNFQNFAKWYNENHPNDGKAYDLDKDIKVDGNRVYGPSTCLFVSPEENKQKAFSSKFSIVSKDGVVVEGFNISEFAKKNGLNHSNLCEVVRGVRISCGGWRKFNQTL